MRRISPLRGAIWLLRPEDTACAGAQEPCRALGLVKALVWMLLALVAGLGLGRLSG